MSLICNLASVNKQMSYSQQAVVPKVLPKYWTLQKLILFGNQGFSDLSNIPVL